MKLPTSLCIKGTDYKIEYVEQYDEVDTEGHFFGIIDYENKIIRIFVSYGESMTLETLIHEVLHSIMFRNKALARMVKDEEDFVVTLANELATLLTDNGLVYDLEFPITKRIL